MRYFIQVLSTGSESLSPSFMLFFDNTRFLFNCGEGIQRYFTQHKIRLIKLNNILLTRLHWSYLGGLPGFILSASDAGSSGVKIIGPRGTNAFIKGLYPFIKRNNFPVEIHDTLSSAIGEMIEADPLKISSFHLSPTKASGCSKLPPINEKGNEMFKNLSSKKICIRNFHEEEHLEESLCEPDDKLYKDDGLRLGDIVTCYLIHCPDKPGKFQAAKAEALGIFGSKRGLLTRGQSITLEDGTTVYPSDLISPHERGKRIFIIEIPTEDYILNNSHLFSSLEIFGDIDLMIFIIGDNIEITSKTSIFKSWFNTIKWKHECQHVIFHGNSHDKPTLFPSSELLSLFLRQKCGSEYFPPLLTSIQERLNFSSKNIIQAMPLMRIFLEPSFSIHHPEPASLTSILKEVSKESPLLLKEHESISKARSNSSEEEQYPALVFLGTGSAIPSKYRNVSSMLLQISASNSILFDCGEGTLGQMARIFSDRLKNVLMTISCIFISHLHADHHLGLAGILRAIHDISPLHSLTIISPVILGTWVRTYRRYFENVLQSISFISSQTLLEGKIIKELDFFVQTCPMHHIPSSFGIIFKIKNEISIAYSGDTRPCELFSKLLKSNNVEILVHEATFEDDLEAQAIQKAHSTWSEAISIAQSANVSYLVLTHFSQRYPVASPPSIATSLLSNGPISFSKEHHGVRVLYAIFDMMRLPFYRLDVYYNLQNKLLTNVEEQFTTMKESIGSDSDIEEEIRFPSTY